MAELSIPQELRTAPMTPERLAEIRRSAAEVADYIGDGLLRDKREFRDRADLLAELNGVRSREHALSEEVGGLRAEVERLRAERDPAPAVDAGETYLVWSNNLAAWWGPNGCHYIADVWKAGRFSEADAVAACRMRTWPKGSPPPEVMVLAPECGRGPFTVDDIRAVPELMRQRVSEATRKAVAERKAGTATSSPSPAPAVAANPVETPR